METAGVILTIIAGLILLAVVATLVFAMVFMVKYAFILIPALVAKWVLGSTTVRKRKSSNKKKK